MFYYGIYYSFSYDICTQYHVEFGAENLSKGYILFMYIVFSYLSGRSLKVRDRSYWLDVHLVELLETV